MAQTTTTYETNQGDLVIFSDTIKDTYIITRPIPSCDGSASETVPTMPKVCATDLEALHSLERSGDVSISLETFDIFEMR